MGKKEKQSPLDKALGVLNVRSKVLPPRGFTAYDLAERLGVSDCVARRYIAEAVKAGKMAYIGSRPGRGNVLVYEVVE